MNGEKVDLQERAQWPQELPGQSRPDRCREPGFLQIFYNEIIYFLENKKKDGKTYLKETKNKSELLV